MKKIITLIVSTFFFFNVNALPNLGISYVNYSNNQIFSHDTIQTAFTITNYGTTMYHTGDTLFVNVRINGILFSLDLLSSAPTPLVLTGMLHTGDNVTVNPGYLLGSQTLPFFPGATSLDICMVLWGKGIASVSPLFGGDSDTLNNVACVTYDPTFTSVFSHEPTSEIKLSVYPNPTIDNITFQSNDGIACIEIAVYDSKGDLIEFIKPKSGLQIISTQDYHSGIYMYKAINSKGVSVSGKFIVNKH